MVARCASDAFRDCLSAELRTHPPRNRHEKAGKILRFKSPAGQEKPIDFPTFIHEPCPFAAAEG